MTYRTKIIFTGLALAFISLLAYAALRTDYFEEQFSRNLKSKNGTIIKKYQKTFEEKEIKRMNNAELTGFLNTVNRDVPDTAMLVIADTEKNIKISSKNDSLIQSSGIYDLILHDFTGSKLISKEPGGYIVRYYGGTKDDKQKKLKYYIFTNNMGTGTLLTVFRHRLDKIIITKAVMEIALIILFIFILCMMAYIIHSRKSDIVSTTETEKPVRPMTTVGRTIDRDERSAIRESIGMVSEGLSAYVFELFQEIRELYHPKSLSLYVTGGRNTLVKLFEYKGNSFLKIDSPAFDTLDMDTDLGRELINGTPLILDKGEKAVLPLVHQGSLLGTIHVSSAKSLSGDEIDRIIQMSPALLKKLSDYMVLSNVMVDRASGMYSETYFKMKLSEAEKNLLKTGKDFSVILISIARNIRRLTEEDKNAVLKTIAPILEDELKDNHLICRYARFIAIMLPETGSTKAAKSARKIFKILSDLRVMLADDEYLDITPYLGLSSSDTATEPRNVLDIAQRNIDLALTRDDGNIQDSRIKV